MNTRSWSWSWCIRLMETFSLHSQRYDDLLFFTVVYWPQAQDNTLFFSDDRAHWQYRLPGICRSFHSSGHCWPCTHASPLYSASLHPGKRPTLNVLNIHLVLGFRKIPHPKSFIRGTVLGQSARPGGATFYVTVFLKMFSKPSAMVFLSLEILHTGPLCHLHWTSTHHPPSP